MPDITNPGLPYNQFGKQEPGSNQEIKEFAASYNVKFDMYKICVNGDDAHTPWKRMKVQPKGRGMLRNAIKWNFTKFLIDQNGCVMRHYGPMEEPKVRKTCHAISSPTSVCPAEPPCPVTPGALRMACLQTSLLVGQS
ncbi:Phospholipid hydroperoxide glutathione peroxidase, mitochondrial [Microtus ochrogaster]|uniref:Glutathione peroxidase n=1 Tax=Microtus ochrogaster TaxID=79684 RepID=A0A8J6KSU7_MICOH|nr:Phospholipid hydroperoxide glutathione peroxidase, mitochondrial [Microtus ochrogaster]